MNKEIEGIRQRAAGPQGFVYELRATSSGYYPNVRGGTTFLNIGAVWKIGQTTKGFSRYSQSDLKRKGLEMIPIPPGGSQVEILIQEKMMIYNYFFQNWTLPPGNYIFR